MTEETNCLTEEEIDALEHQIPHIARVATKAAYEQALEVSERVLCVDSGNLVWASRDSSKTFVAKAQPRRKVKVGQVITVRRFGVHVDDEGA